MARIVTYDQDHKLNVPLYGGAADISKGALVMRGATPATNNGMAILASGAGADIIGIATTGLDYSVDGETLIAGTAHVVKPVEPIAPFRAVRMEYDKTSVITCTQAVSTTTMTVTSLEDNIDAAFLYTVAGTGSGQTNYLTASAAGSCTLKAAFGTSLSTDTTFLKILPRFHPLGGLVSAGTKLASTAAAGSWTVMILDSFIERNGRMEPLDPTKHAALTGLSSLASVRFWADVLVRNGVPYSID
jgi:hypothetical protein